MTDLGAALRAAREAAGVSLAVMAARTHYSKPLLGLLETGKRTIKPEHVQAYGRALNVPTEILQGPPDDPLRVTHEWLVSDSPTVVQLRAGRRVGAMLADELETRVIELRHLDDMVGGGDLFSVASKELSEAQGVVQSASYTDNVGRRLLTVVGELAQLTGWVASDAGRYAEAQRVYLDGVSAAQGADNRPLAAQLLSSLSYSTRWPTLEKHTTRFCWHGLPSQEPGIPHRLSEPYCWNGWPGRVPKVEITHARGESWTRWTTHTRVGRRELLNRNGFTGSTEARSM